MSFLRRVLGRLLHRWRLASAHRRLLAPAADLSPEITRADWASSLSDPTAFYARCYRSFHTALPADLHAHRKFFTQQGRGFGEDAFHVMWLQLFREFHPRSYLEIGVFRGQTLSLAGLLAQRSGEPCETFGISPFAAVGDSVSTYTGGLDYRRDTLQNFAHFASPPPTLLKAYSTDEAARALIASRAWDVVYIDGNHDYDIARQDWENCARAVRPGGLIVLDDSGLSTRYQPPPFATGGHPGPSQLASEIDRSAFEEILQVGHNRVFRKRPAPVTG